MNYELCLISNLVWSRSVTTLSPDGLCRRTCQVEINPLRLKSIKINRRVHLFSSQSRESVNSWINETAPVFFIPTAQRRTMETCFEKKL